MGKLEKRKTRAEFETLSQVFSAGHNRPVVINLKPFFMELRLKGTRRVYTLPYSTAFTQALVAQKLAEQRAKKAAKKESKKL